jgi:hypothetical protein
LAVSELQVEHQLGDIMQSILERAGLGGDEFEVYVVNGRVQAGGRTSRTATTSGCTRSWPGAEYGISAKGW